MPFASEPATRVEQRDRDTETVEVVGIETRRDVAFEDADARCAPSEASVCFNNVVLLAPSADMRLTERTPATRRST